MDQLETQPVDEDEIPKLDDNDMIPGKILALIQLSFKPRYSSVGTCYSSCILGPELMSNIVKENLWLCSNYLHYGPCYLP